MIKIFRKKNAQGIWDFKGGIYPPEMKHQSRHIPLRRLPLANYFIVPLKQHIGQSGNLLVKEGEYVLKGQPLTWGENRHLPVHAPTSGIISKIGLSTVAHPSGLSDVCIRIDADGKDRWITHQGIVNYQDYTPQHLIAYLHQSGIAGLGGAGFPTAAKLLSGLTKIETLIINGAECEPYITADDRLMQEHAKEIAEGCAILQYIVKPKLTIIGIEDNKPEAIREITKSIKDLPNIEVKVVPTKYPSGGAKQLTKLLTGNEIPFSHHSADIGVLMQNVGTVYAIQRAIMYGEPLIERVVTLTGNAINKKGNVWLPIGTPIKHVLAHCDYNRDKQHNYHLPRVIMGGPLMGFTLPHSDVPVIKTTNCLLAPDDKEIPLIDKEQSCIRCGLCTDACPAGLLPQQLYWFSKGKEHNNTAKYHITDCIECGACAYVCPSNIPLVHYYRQEKSILTAINEETLRTQQARLRFEARKQRIDQQNQAILEKHKQAANKTSEQDKAAIQAALARLRQKQNLNNENTPVEITHKNQNILSNLSKVISDNSTNKVVSEQKQADSQQKLTSAAIARAKARKANVQTAFRVQETEPTQIIKNNGVDETSVELTAEQLRKQAATEAIARAKARKANAQNAVMVQETEPTQIIKNNGVDETSVELTAEQLRKQAATEAIARAKARKANAQTAFRVQETEPTQIIKNNGVDETSVELTAEQLRKQAVTDAIARAKARKANAQNVVKVQETEPTQSIKHNDVDETSVELTAEQLRKQAVTDAIARAKARKNC